jgi:glycine/D-amino acid oxidase-like deaminating enzyme
LFADDFRAEPYWWDEARPVPAGETDSPPGSVDVAVIGGGYTGLSAALELARGGARVAVLDAGDLGSGASTRSGGILSGAVHVGSGGALDRRLGPERIRALLAEAAHAYAHLESLIERERIDCDYQQTGRYVAAHCPRAYRELEARARVLEAASGCGARTLPRERQREELASDYYHGGMVVERWGGLHPARYHAGLVAACRRQGAVLCGGAEVRALEGRPGAFVLETPRGRLRAGRVLVATNGYTGPLTPWQRRRLVPLNSYIIVTEDLGEERVRALVPGLRMVVDTHRLLRYYRPCPDRRRIVFGGRASFAFRGAVETARVLHGFMVDVFPELRDTRITRAWTGHVAFSFDGLPHVGEHDGLNYALGCNGSGVSLLSYLGARAGRRLLGVDEPASAFEALPFPARPLYRGRPWFLPAVGAWYRFRDRLDRRLGGP